MLLAEESTVDIEQHVPTSSVARHRCSIAIIGLGAVGVAVFNDLVNEVAKTYHADLFTVDLYDRDHHYGTGVAYGTTLDQHILNMRSDVMSAVVNQPNHFLAWLLASGVRRPHPRVTRGVVAEDYMPRRVFGFYLKDLFTTAMRMAKALRMQVRIIRQQAQTVEDLKTHFHVKTLSETRRYDYVILCIGNQPPARLPGLQGRPLFFDHAWPEQRLLNDVPRKASVMVLGSGLTAIDTFLTLHANRHEGLVTFASRHGILPKVRGYPEDYSLEYLGDGARTRRKLSNDFLTLCDAADLLLREMIHAGAIPAIPPARVDKLAKRALLLFRLHLERLGSTPHVDVLRQDLAASRSPEAFSVLKALDEVIGAVWNLLSPSEQAAFDRTLASLWNAYDYPMPAQNGYRVLEALDSGQLSVARLVSQPSFDLSTNKFVTQCRTTGTAVVDIWSDCVINATGQNLDITKADNPLLATGLNNGILSFHPSGGIDVEYETGAVITQGGTPNRKLYIVGSLTRGVHFYTNSISQNTAAGHRAVRAILAERARVRRNTRKNEVAAHGK